MQAAIKACRAVCWQKKRANVKKCHNCITLTEQRYFWLGIYCAILSLLSILKKNIFKNQIFSGSCFIVWCSVLFLRCMLKRFVLFKNSTMVVWLCWRVYSSSGAIQTKVVFLFSSACVSIPLSVFYKACLMAERKPLKDTKKCRHFSV